MGLPEVIDWYARKTDFLLEKYGPGPRVHYHTGLVGPQVEPAGDLASLRRQIFDSQEAMLAQAARAWDAAQHLRGDVLDVGCGLGGGPLYWAQEYGATVTALTPVPAHAALVDRFANAAGVGARVRTEIGDAHAVAGSARFDAAVATGASNYFDRARWFRCLAGVLRPEGKVFIEDTFLGRAEMAAHFNDYWLSNIGAFDEYVTAATDAGFRLAGCVDVTAAAAGFWRLSVAYSELLLAEDGLAPGEIAARRRSIAWQSRVYAAYLDGGFRNLLLHFERHRR